jgi:hypothetical protein
VSKMGFIKLFEQPSNKLTEFEVEFIYRSENQLGVSYDDKCEGKDNYDSFHRRMMVSIFSKASVSMNCWTPS